MKRLIQSFSLVILLLFGYQSMAHVLLSSPTNSDLEKLGEVADWFSKGKQLTSKLSDKTIV